MLAAVEQNTGNVGRALASQMEVGFKFCNDKLDTHDALLADLRATQAKQAEEISELRKQWA
eukprot:8591918-Karenia_brevis.AAC.1